MIMMKKKVERAMLMMMSLLQHWLLKLQLIHLLGTLTFFRVYSGVLKSGIMVYNPVKRQKKERIGRILTNAFKSREEIKEVYAGDIAAAVGLKRCNNR